MYVTTTYLDVIDAFEMVRVVRHQDRLDGRLAGNDPVLLAESSEQVATVVHD